MMRAHFSAYWRNASSWNGSMSYRMKQTSDMSTSVKPRAHLTVVPASIGSMRIEPSGLPNITKVAALLGDRARGDMMNALMSGRAVTATELATIADVTKATASTHLAKLRQAGLIASETHGRHRYFMVANERVAQALENRMVIA